MFIADRTIKVMLGIIIVLLMVIAGNRLMTPATAQNSSTSSSSGLVEATWKTEMISRMKLDSADRIKSIQTLDQANAVVVQFEDRIEFYRMRPVYVNPDNLQLKSKATNGITITPEIR